MHRRRVPAMPVPPLAPLTPPHAGLKRDKPQTLRYLHASLPYYGLPHAS